MAEELDRLDLMDMFRRDMTGVEVTSIRHDDDPHPAFKSDPLTFKYEQSTYLFKVWSAGRHSAQLHSLQGGEAVANLQEAKSLLALAAGANAKHPGMWGRNVNSAAHRIAHAIEVLSNQPVVAEAEPVEVVAHAFKCEDKIRLTPTSALPRTERWIDLMTVTQHQRIVAALSAENQRIVPVEPLLAPPHPLEIKRASVLKDCNVSYSANTAPPASGAVPVPRELLELIEQSWRVPNGLPKSVPGHVEAKIENGLRELRALLAKGVQS